MKAYQIYHKKKANRENLPPEYIANKFKLYELKRKIEAENDLLISLARDHQDRISKVKIKVKELETIQKNNETPIQELDKERAELTTEKKKYQIGKNVLMVLTILTFSLATATVISSLPAALILASLAIVGVVGESILQQKANKTNNKIIDLYTESYRLKQPIAKLERDLKFQNNIISSLANESSTCQRRLEQLKAEQLALEENISRFNPNQLDSSISWMNAVHKKGLFKTDNTSTKLTQLTEDDMCMKL
ncbi:hypothetical protein [Legionella cincinnatiensis]|uniref:Uncharacterized protein n=1 Tax=Legionella cincinnatiensis TaxID=28085 RepID=A0A378IKC4_9GAMM|nr:hypothetical protein [Legionella cincinnatiensis]KTC89188.1 hypothetical protein Lcin_1226 [Legionella cincinnatiensis]STX35380.1 Uncharacterised protein [Legionella cincinnatiensis]